jgi:hypothetical protein
MSEQPIRFLHAGHLRLDEPLHGLAEVPEHLLDRLADAPYTAAEQVFATALSEEVDFVLLTGQQMDVHRAGPRGMVFLLSQFERLQEREIAVYWAASDHDHWDQWPSGCQLPDNVHVFPVGKVEEVSHFVDSTPVATILGRSGVARGGIRAVDFHADYGGQFSIAAVNGAADTKALSQQRIDYWALGGQATRETLFSKPRTAHDCGSPQGRGPLEAGVHGCTLAKVAGGRTILTPIACDAIRWQSAAAEVPRPATLERLEQLLDEQTRRQAVDADRPQLVTWQLEGVERLEGVSRSGAWRRELAAKLRTRHGGGEAGVWTVALEAVLPESPPDQWLDENTMLGDFLRELQEFEFRRENEGTLQERLGQLGLSGHLPQICDLSDRSEQQRVIREAAKLGADLLRGNA